MPPVINGCMPKKYKDIYDQLLKNSRINGKCLESTYRPNPLGCPYVTHKRKLIRVSRAAWEYHKGKIPEGMFVCHRCDNPKCFLVKHMFLGTASDNMQDMMRKRRDNIFGRRKYPFDLLEKAKELREEGYSYRDIADKLNMKKADVSAYLWRHKVKKGPPKPYPRKIPLQIIEEIIERKKKWMSDVEIYKELGISESTYYLRVKMHNESLVNNSFTLIE